MKKRKIEIATNPDLITAADTSAYLGVNNKTLIRWSNEGRGPTRARIGGRAYYFKPEVQAWVENKFNAPAS